MTVTIVEEKIEQIIHHCAIVCNFFFFNKKQQIFKNEIFPHSSGQRLNLLYFKIYFSVLIRKKTVHFFLMCSPGVFYINNFEMVELGKLCLNLEQVSTRVLGVLYSYTD